MQNADGETEHRSMSVYKRCLPIWNIQISEAYFIAYLYTPVSVSPPELLGVK